MEKWWRSNEESLFDDVSSEAHTHIYIYIYNSFSCPLYICAFFSLSILSFSLLNGQSGMREKERRNQKKKFCIEKCKKSFFSPPLQTQTS